MDLIVGDIFRNAARAVPDQVAASLGSASITFAELDQRANRTARSLSGLGVGRGDRVVVWSDTDLDTIPAFAAAAKLGAVLAPLNPRLSIAEATATVAAATPALVLVDAGRVEAGADLARALGAALIDHAALAALAAGEDRSPVEAPGLVESDPHVVFFTSGTAGRVKGVVLSHRVNCLRSHPGALLEPRGAMVCPYPLFHMGGWTLAMQQWQARDQVVFVASADAETICAAVERHRAARLNCIPAVWQRILAHLETPLGAARDLSCLRFADTGTSATPMALLEAIDAAFPVAQIRVFYGSTESGSVASLAPADWRRKPGSCGVPAPWAEVRLDVGGELCVRGPLLFDGYFNDPAATRQALIDGWYHTGDLAEVDADGYLTIVGRVGEIIRTGGESVAPAEVEQVLGTHPAVADLAVVGLPDQRWGEIICAVVVPKTGSDPPTLEDLRAHCQGRLASYKQPRRIAVVEAIPRTTATNQVQRRLLVEQVAADTEGARP
jgi:fatty-acyl-CoA synthase